MPVQQLTEEKYLEYYMIMLDFARIIIMNIIGFWRGMGRLASGTVYTPRCGSASLV
jgi:hypothetical protein